MCAIDFQTEEKVLGLNKNEILYVFLFSAKTYTFGLKVNLT